ncbi:MAG: hypothetical protein CMJ78_02090 [Planctomycetaceae bacterium]|nr:hypothetical protein [Planctomycetaceae bacterium]
MRRQASVVLVVMVGMTAMVLLALLWLSEAPVPAANLAGDEVRQPSESEGNLDHEDEASLSANESVGDTAKNADASFDAEPSPSLKPREVVTIQLKALQANNQKDDGIATCFRFASPGNRQLTGPLPRFASMVKTPPYSTMLGVKDFEVSEPQIEEGQAVVITKLIGAEGQTLVFVFVLGKQTQEPYQDCWMTESVYPVQRQAPAAKPGLRI